MSAVVLGGAPASAQELARFEFSEPHMGTEFRVVLYAPDESVASQAARAAFDLVERFDSLFSDYRDDSEIAAIAAAAGSGEWYPASGELKKLLVITKDIAERSGGAFDPTVGPLTALWRWSSRRGELPDSARLARARALVGHEALEVGPAGVRLGRAGMSLDLGGIAKGFAADAMLTTISTSCGGTAPAGGCGAAMIDAGGDIRVGAAPPGTDGWRIATPAGDTLTLEHAAVATSGDTSRHVDIDGVRYSHIVDPDSGLGLVGVEPVTVVAPFAFVADALASALSVMDREAGDALLSDYRATRRVESVDSTGSNR